MNKTDKLARTLYEVSRRAWSKTGNGYEMALWSEISGSEVFMMRVLARYVLRREAKLRKGRK